MMIRPSASSRSFRQPRALDDVPARGRQLGWRLILNAGHLDDASLAAPAA
jgi:hypothetical protein